MDKAVARIEQAVENEEAIVIYGDYDVDGISATAILYECLSSMGAHVRCKLPTRGTGYGLTRPALESLAEKGFKLVVTVDNGISAIEEAACAKELGLDLIVTDHHLPGETLPDAVAVVDPKRADDESPFKDLCGAGVYPFILIYQLPDRASGQLVQVVVIISEDSPGQLQSCLSSDTGTKQNSEQLTDRKRSNTLCKQFFPRQFISSPGIHR